MYGGSVTSGNSISLLRRFDAVTTVAVDSPAIRITTAERKQCGLCKNLISFGSYDMQGKS